ncbi:MAG TPA: flavoprotein [Methylophaga aminisulfidivorans]|uniref:Archaeal flavoprotein n=2 Tax=Methylophaga TaxID=40222 RepID=F5SZ19_9GAMM|nr:MULTISPECIES: flavoprotein [Methylophaga]EGL54372.1 archaeal flavoprotein [Methylophaga aminisulfidivorans MP]WVI85562.1 flavoprotein [Methylophaga thalassica]HIM38887.1 flavoprotein [Methylophaga aminisulfidivorans]
MQARPEKPRLAWAVTGSGHYLKECLEIVRELEDVDLFYSRAGEEVVRMYGYDPKSQVPEGRVYRDRAASAPPVGLFYRGDYHSLVVAPATSNTVAKMVLGISDTLVTNIFAQAGKCQIPSIVLACDSEPEIDTPAPDRIVRVWPRRIDLEHTKTLKTFEATTVVDDADQLFAALKIRLKEVG